VGAVAANCCGEDRRGRRSVEMEGVPLASVYLCGFSGLLCQGQKGGERWRLVFFLKRRGCDQGRETGLGFLSLGFLCLALLF
jgi:hypothetical protein